MVNLISHVLSVLCIVVFLSLILVSSAAYCVKVDVHIPGGTIKFIVSTVISMASLASMMAVLFVTGDNQRAYTRKLYSLDD